MSSDLSPHAHALAPGTQIRDYTIVSVIGTGGFSIVYKAIDKSLDRAVAIKEYFPGSFALRDHEGSVRPHSRDTAMFAKGIESFLNEGKLLAAFDHPALVRVYRCWEERGTAYLAMRLYEGTTLRDAVNAGDWRTDEATLRALLLPMCNALDVLHAAKCYHRDVAPDNIMLVAGSHEGSRLAPVLLDFGAARKAIESTQVFTAILKPGYAPIEQYGDGELKQGPWTDIYALAGVVHFTLAGSAPPTAISRMIKDGMPRPRDAFGGRLPDHWLDAIETALAVKPDLRPVNISAFRALFRWDEMQTLAAVAQPGTRAVTPAETSAVDDERTVVAVRPAQSAPTAAIAPTKKSPPAASRRGFAVAWVAMLAMIVVIGVTAALLLDGPAREHGGNTPAKAATSPIAAPTAPIAAPPTEIKADADTSGTKKTSLPSEPARKAAPPVQEPAVKATGEQPDVKPPRPLRQKQVQTEGSEGQKPVNSGARPARCGSLIERFGLGELLSTEEQQFIRERCK